uniref:Uncharacterized protein n=1 Tax=Meloidogyne javanica TaxID=6303 RepID=A0A915LGH6_MELJA
MPQGKDKTKKGSQHGGANSGPKISGNNSGQKLFEEAGESSSSLKQNEETKKAPKGKENQKPKGAPSNLEQNVLSVGSGGGGEAIHIANSGNRELSTKTDDDSFVAGSGLGIILEQSSSIQSNSEAVKTNNKRKRNSKNKKENQKKSPTPEGNKSSDFGNSGGSISTISEPETKRCAGEEESGVPCLFKKGYLKVSKRNKMFKEQKEEFENTLLQKAKDFKALAKELVDGFFEENKKLKFLLEIPHNTVVNIKEMMDLDAEKFYERIDELNTELCHSAGKKKRKVQKKIYKAPRELLNKAEKILSDEGDGIFACELVFTHRIFYSGKYKIEEVEEYIKDSRKFINYMKAINEIALFADFKYYFPLGDELYREFAQKVYINVINEDICVFGDGPYRFYYQAADTPQTVATPVKTLKK